MDLRSYFKSASSSHQSCSTSIDSSNSSSSETESDKSTEHSPPKRHCTSTSKAPVKSSIVRQYNKKWEEKCPWLLYDEDCQGVFCKECKKAGKSLQRTGGTWVTKPFTNWKKALEKMKAHSQSDIHVQACQASMLAERAAREGTIMQQLQQITDEEKMKNRAAVKALIHCTHFLAHQHIAYSTNFEELVGLVVACGGEDLKTFLESAGKNAMYTSRIAVTEFSEALAWYMGRRVYIRHHSIASWQTNVQMFLLLRSYLSSADG